MNSRLVSLGDFDEEQHFMREVIVNGSKEVMKTSMLTQDKRPVLNPVRLPLKTLLEHIKESCLCDGKINAWLDVTCSTCTRLANAPKHS